MVGLTKNVLYKSLGRSTLPFEQLKEALLEAELILNNRSLGYLEDDIQFPALTPNMLIHGSNISLPDEIMDNDPDFNSPTTSRCWKTLTVGRMPYGIVGVTNSYDLWEKDTNVSMAPNLCL